MQPTTSASPFAPTATPAAPATPAYQPLNLKAYDDSVNADANQSSGQIQGALSKFEASRRNPLDIYNDAVSQLGVGDVRSRVTNLRNQLLNTENLLNNVDSSVTGRTQGSLVTEAQRQRLVNLEREPITKDYGKQTQSLSDENANLADLLRQADSQSNLAVQGQTARQQALQFALEQAQGREKFAEDTRRWRAEQALRQRQLDASIAQQRSAAAGLSLPKAGAAPKINTVAVATDYARQAKDQLLRKGGNQPFARENVRDSLINQFGLSKAQADAIIYKDVFPDNWAGGTASPAQQRSLMSAVGYSGAF